MRSTAFPAAITRGRRRNSAAGSTPSGHRRPAGFFPELIPRELTTAPSDPDGPSQAECAAFTDRYARGQRAGRRAAFAVSGIESFGLALGQRDGEAAKAAAMAECEANVRTRFSRLSAAAAGWCRDRGWDRCRVVDLRTK